MQSGEGCQTAARRVQRGTLCQSARAARNRQEKHWSAGGDADGASASFVVRDCALCALRPGCRPIGLVGAPSGRR